MKRGEALEFLAGGDSSANANDRRKTEERKKIRSNKRYKSGEEAENDILSTVSVEEDAFSHDPIQEEEYRDLPRVSSHIIIPKEYVMATLKSKPTSKNQVFCECPVGLYVFVPVRVLILFFCCLEMSAMVPRLKGSRRGASPSGSYSKQPWNVHNQILPETSFGAL